jgi:ABC-type antimicrobial peptide transport system permease subunit
VGGITADLNMQQVQLELGKAQKLLGIGDRVTGLYFRSGMDADRMPWDKYTANITSLQHLRSVLLAIKHDVFIIVYTTMCFSFAMMIVFILMLLNLSIEERKPEYANLLSLGHDVKSVSKIIFSEVAFLVSMSLLGCIPLSIGMALLLNYRVSSAFFDVQFIYSLGNFLLPMICAIVCAFIAAFFGARSVIRINIVSALRARGIG